MTFVQFFKKLKYSLTWDHQWDDAGAARRTCVTCGRIEFLTHDGWGEHFRIEQVGDSEKHDFECQAAVRGPQLSLVTVDACTVELNASDEPASADPGAMPELPRAS